METDEYPTYAVEINNMKIWERIWDKLVTFDEKYSWWVAGVASTVLLGSIIIRLAM